MSIEAAADRIKLTDLRSKMKLQGKISGTELFGAFVDVGAERDGFLHISQLRQERTNRVEDVVKPDQEVTVWVRKVDPAAGRIDLTMIEPLALDWHEIKVGLIVKGKVAKLEKFGAFVDIGAEKAGFVHVREVTSGYVASPADALKLGQEVEAKVIAVDRKRRRIDLSMKALEEPAAEEEDAPEEEPMTPMEAALRAAMKDTAIEFGGAKERRRRKDKRARGDLEAVFERTRRQHAASKN